MLPCLCLSMASPWHRYIYVLGEGCCRKEKASLFSHMSPLMRAQICNSVRSSHPLTSFNLTFLEALSPNTVTWGIMASTNKFLLLLLFSCSVVSDSWQCHGLQYSRLLCPPLSPAVCSDSCPLSSWCYPTISSSAAPFSFYLQSFPASGSFPVSQLFIAGGQSIGASSSVLPMDIQGWFPLGWTGWISLLCKLLSRVFSITR